MWFSLDWCRKIIQSEFLQVLTAMQLAVRKMLELHQQEGCSSVTWEVPTAQNLPFRAVPSPLPSHGGADGGTFTLRPPRGRLCPAGSAPRPSSRLPGERARAPRGTRTEAGPGAGLGRDWLVRGMGGYITAQVRSAWVP